MQREVRRALPHNGRMGAKKVGSAAGWEGEVDAPAKEDALLWLLLLGPALGQGGRARGAGVGLGCGPSTVRLSPAPFKALEMGVEPSRLFALGKLLLGSTSYTPAPVCSALLW